MQHIVIAQFKACATDNTQEVAIEVREHFKPDSIACESHFSVTSTHPMYDGAEPQQFGDLAQAIAFAAEHVREILAGE